MGSPLTISTSHNGSPDIDLAEISRQGDGAALTLLYYRHLPTIKRASYAFIRRYSYAIAYTEYEDVQQQAFIAFHDTVRKWNPDILDLPTYTACHLKYELLKHLRPYRRVERPLAYLAEDLHAALPDELALLLRQLVNQLPTRQRRVVYHRYWLDEPSAIIAQRMRTTARTVNRQLQQALATLRNRLGGAMNYEL